MRSEKRGLTPFAFNDANNYFWQRQGKKHYWGMKGKDYGFLESIQDRQRHSQTVVLDDLKNQHLHLQAQQYEQIPSARHHYPQNNDFHIKLQPVEYRQTPLKINYDDHKNYFSEKPNIPSRLQTEPDQPLSQNDQYLSESRMQAKKKNLSLMSRNVSMSNQKLPNQYKLPDEQVPTPAANRNYHVRVRSEATDVSEIEKYRDRIGRVVKKDRRNSPTYCNSLAYPLHCYRYLE